MDDDGAAPKPGARGGKRAVPLPVPAGSDAIARAARVPRRAAFPPENAAAHAPAEAGSGGAGAGAGVEDDDEQVEKFYALLDNIRAMRGAYGGAGDGDHGDGTGADGVEVGGGGARKRLRAADPPWRPAFRIEDFEEPSPTSSSDDPPAHRAKKTPRQEADAEEGGARLAAASASASASPPPPQRAGVRLDSSGRKSI